MRPLDPKTKVSAVVHTRVPLDMLEALEKKARRKRINLSNLVRNVLEAYLKPEEGIEV